jgi:hypothetical protein
MPIDNNLLEARYTSPSGGVHVFEWEKVERQTELKTGIFTFPDKDGAHVQHQGAGAFSYPLVCIFSGEDSFERADAFEAALIERGVGELQHPVYGILKVKPTGNIKRENDLVSNANESIVTTTFTETITDEETPVLDAVTADVIDEKMENFTEAAAEDFAVSITTENVEEQLALQSVLETQTNAINENMADMVSGADSKNKAAFLTTMKELKSNIQDLYEKGQGAIKTADSTIHKSLNIARQTINTLKLPSRFVINVTEKLKGYSQLIVGLVNQYRNDPFGINNMKNAFMSTRMVLTGAVATIASGGALSIMEAASIFTSSGVPYGGTVTREGAMETTAALSGLLKTATEFEDSKIEQNKFIDSNSNTYLELLEIVYISIQLIMNVTFSLPMKRTIFLDRDRQVIELCAELYGTVSNEVLDKFIIENNFNLDEIELLPMGREVSYYVQSA